MLTGGIDVGTSAVKAVILEDGKLLSYCVSAVSKRDEEVGLMAMERAIEKMKKGVSMNDIDIVSTGTKGKGISVAKKFITVPRAISTAVHELYSGNRTVLVMGAENTMAMKIGENGHIDDMVYNDKCSAGSGLFIDYMAKTANLTLDEMSTISLSAKTVPIITSTCVIFAEQEVITLVNENEDLSVGEIVAGIYTSLAVKMVGLLRQVGITREILFSGGVANNRGFIHSLEERLDVPIVVPENPQLMAAIGAALFARDQV